MKSFQELLQELSIRMERSTFDVDVLYTLSQKGKKQQKLTVGMIIPAPDKFEANKEASKQMAIAINKLKQTIPDGRVTGSIQSIKPSPRV